MTIMKKKSAVLLLILLFLSGILGDTALDVRSAERDRSPGQVMGHSVQEDTGSITESLPDDHQVSAIQSRPMAGSVLLSTLGKRNNALFIKNLIQKVLYAFFTAFFHGFGKCFAAILLIYLAFTGKLIVQLRILHQTDGKKRIFV